MQRFLIIIFGLLLFSCTQKNIQKVSDDLKILGEVQQIIDTSFVIKNKVQRIENITTYNFRKGNIAKQFNYIIINKDSTKSTSKYYYNSYGNLKKTEVFNDADELKETTYWKFDKHGNHIEVKNVGQAKPHTSKYTYEYKNGLKVKMIVSANNKYIHTETYDYDANGNMTRQDHQSSWLDSQNLYEYNSDNNVTRYQHIRNGSSDYYVKYIYEDTLLLRREDYNLDDTKTGERTYAYNERGQLIFEEEKRYGKKTEFLNFDDMGNWLGKEKYYYRQLERYTSRTIQYR